MGGTVIGTAAHVSDVTQAHALLHGDETDVFGDAGYQGVEKREEHLETSATWHVAMRPGKRRALDKSPEGERQEWLEHAKASIRAKVEHPFHVVKSVSPPEDALSGIGQEHGSHLLTVCLANLMLARRGLLDAGSQVAF